MQLASIPKNVLAANQQVAGSLTTAHGLTMKARSAVATASTESSTLASDVRAALDAATQARDGVKALGDANLLDQTFQRFTNHAVRDLSSALAMLDRKGPLTDAGASILADQLFDAQVATRRGSEAGERSLASPAPKALLSAQAFAGSEAGGTTNNGPVWVDGQWLDALGNPVRGGNTWSGPDGQQFNSDGSPDAGGSRSGGDGWISGPDGQTWGGI